MGCFGEVTAGSIEIDTESLAIVRFPHRPAAVAFRPWAQTTISNKNKSRRAVIALREVFIP